MQPTQYAQKMTLMYTVIQVDNVIKQTSWALRHLHISYGGFISTVITLRIKLYTRPRWNVSSTINTGIKIYGIGLQYVFIYYIQFSWSTSLLLIDYG